MPREDGSAATTTETDAVLIVIGAGQAGAELAVQARETGWTGRIMLVGDEPGLPYQRPPLSKAYLAGHAVQFTVAPDISFRQHCFRQQLALLRSGS